MICCGYAEKTRKLSSAFVYLGFRIEEFSELWRTLELWGQFT
jgi:hypothetical protein